MKIIKSSSRSHPKVSLILLDWSVRESFHLLHYLSKQNIDRDLFEVIIIEYFSRTSDAIRVFEDQVDLWLLLEMPAGCYYHKHLMYNAGIVVARGEICVICDSDAMVTPGFISSIIAEFEDNPNTVLHIDQFRNMRKDLYPFCYPNFAEVIGVGCINNVDGKTRGVVEDKDPIHNRNYGACMCARRDDLIAIGGADEHIDYLGHICGPYEMTFRLINLGHREVWHQTEFMYHTWHPGQAGEDNYLGPHDGRHISSTALNALISGRILPLEMNKSIKNIRLGTKPAFGIETFQFDEEHFIAWQSDNVQAGMQQSLSNSSRNIHHSFVVDETASGYVAYPSITEHPKFLRFKEQCKIHASTKVELHERLDHSIPFSFRLIFPMVTLLICVSLALVLPVFYLQRRFSRLSLGVQT